MRRLVRAVLVELASAGQRMWEALEPLSPCADCDPDCECARYDQDDPDDEPIAAWPPDHTPSTADLDFVLWGREVAS